MTVPPLRTRADFNKTEILILSDVYTLFSVNEAKNKTVLLLSRFCALYNPPRWMFTSVR